MYLIFYSFLHRSKMHWYMWTISNKVISWTKHSTRKVKPFLGKEHIIYYMGYASNTKNNKDHENNSCQLHYSCHQKINGLSNILFLKCSLKSGSVSQQSFRHSRQNRCNYSCLIKKQESTAKFCHLVEAMPCNKDVFVFNPWYAKILPCRVILLTLIFVDIAVL